MLVISLMAVGLVRQCLVSACSAEDTDGGWGLGVRGGCHESPDFYSLWVSVFIYPVHPPDEEMHTL